MVIIFLTKDSYKINQLTLNYIFMDETPLSPLYVQIDQTYQCQGYPLVTKVAKH